MNKKLSEVFEKLKTEKQPLMKKYIALIVLAFTGIVLLLVSSFLPSEKSEEKRVSPSSSAESSAAYTEKAEKKLTELISSIDGAGKVKVMITFDSFYENVYAKGYSTKDETSENGFKEETSEEYITVKNGSSSEQCLVVKVYEPVVRGVAVSAEGAGNAQIRKSITDTVTAVYGISSTKVSVEKMKYTQEEK